VCVCVCNFFEALKTKCCYVVLFRMPVASRRIAERIFMSIDML